MDETPQRVLVVIPHPDDAEFWCGGSVARWISEGAQVRFVLCTDGSKGSTDPNMTSQELTPIREEEQIKAAEALGVQELVLLRLVDGTLEDTDDFRRELVRHIRQVRPDVVICPEPYRKNLAWHRDHRIAGQVTLDAVFPCARDHLHFEELWRDEGLEPHKTGTVLFWGTESADTFVDISGNLETKLRAVSVYASQLNGRTPQEIEGFVKQQAKDGAEDSGLEYSESFRKQTFRT